MSERRQPAQAALPRGPGLRGDLGHMLAVLMGVGRVRRRRASLGRARQVQQQRREVLLAAMAREAIADDAVDLPAVITAREQVAGIDGTRARHTGDAAAAAAEIAALLDAQEVDAVAAEVEGDRLQREIRDTDRELAPLDREEREYDKNLGRLRNTLKVLDKRLRRLEARAGLEADLASARAERELLAREEAAARAALASLASRIAGLRALRQACAQQLTSVREVADEVRAASELRIAAAREREAAARAAAAAAAQDRRELLRRLGEQLCTAWLGEPEDGRPEAAAERLRTIAHLDALLADLDQQTRDCEALLASIHRPALIRGTMVITAFLGAMGAAVWAAWALG